MKRATTALLALVAVAAAWGDEPPASPAEPLTVPPGVDRRELVLVDSSCRSQLGRRDVTLFANGTVRLRDGLKGSLQMSLGELGDSELAAFVQRLRGIDLSEVEGNQSAPDGPWTEHCRIDLSLPGSTSRHYDYDRYASLPLSLAALVRIVDDLSTHVQADSRADHLPAGYEPRAGDVLERTDGALFEVVGMTSDGKGVELEGRDQPLTVYVPTSQLSNQFVSLVSRAATP